MKRFPLHLFLFCAFPAVFLYANNLDYSDFHEFVELALLLLGIAGATWGVIRVTQSSSGRLQNLLLASFFFGSLYLYGPLNLVLGGIVVSFGISLRVFDYLLIVILVAFLLFLFGWIKRTSAGALAGLTFFLNMTALVLWGASLAQVAQYYSESVPQSARSNLESELSKQIASGKKVEPLPDIYYIILDGYARGDVLKTMYGFDNEPFLSRLRELGFYVADKSTPNYPQTALSLASSLNMEYLDHLLPGVARHNIQLKPFFTLIHQSLIVSLLRREGYSFLCYANGWNSTENMPADRLLGPPDDNKLLTLFLGNLNFPGLRDYIARLQHDEFRTKQRYILENLGNETSAHTPLFVFAHVVNPHPPFIFQADGEPRFPGKSFSMEDGEPYGPLQNYRENYLAQVQFVNRMLLRRISILLETRKDAIVILQGDHGPGSHFHMVRKEDAYLPERFSIFNAYRLPASGRERLYNSISPVNSFRVVLNALFGTNIPLLPDKSFYASYLRPFWYRELNQSEIEFHLEVEPPHFDRERLFHSLSQ
ncbi:MAG: sulfatase-like hydrolase/transferase [Bdellovibrionales bacterium]|nr:sulfatase-like hydrolase/transferase [Bdellovibrionales bacterium]